MRTLRVLPTRASVEVDLAGQACTEGVAFGMSVLARADFDERVRRGCGVALGDDVVGRLVSIGVTGSVVEGRRSLTAWNRVREAGLDVAALEGARTGASGFAARRLGELIDFARAYEQEMARVGVRDRVGARLLVARGVSEVRLAPVLHDTRALRFEQATEATDIDLATFAGLRAAGFEVEVEGPDIAAFDLESARDRMTAAGIAVSSRALPEGTGGTVVRALERAEPLEGGEFELALADDPRAEASAVTAKVAAALTRGHAPSDIAIIAASEASRKAVQHEFRAIDLDVFEPRGARLVETAPVRFLLAVLAAFEGRSSRRDLERIARSRWLETTPVRDAPLTEPPVRASLAEHMAFVRRVSDAFGLADACERLREPREARVARIEAEAVGDECRALVELLRTCDELEAAANRAGTRTRAMARNDAFALLRDELVRRRIGTRGIRGGAVALLGPRDLGGRGFRRVFVIGLSRAAGRADADDQALDPLLGATRLRTRRLDDARVRLALASARDSLFVSAHAFDGRGRRVQPSSTWSQLAALAEPTRVASVAVPELERATTLAHVACRLHVDGARDPRLTGPDTRAALRAARGYAATIVRISPSALADAAPRLGHPGVHATTSATALEAYVACPFRFLAERVLELSGPERASEELDPAARGSLRHHVAAAVLVHLQRLGLLPLRGGEAAPRESAEALVAARLALQEWKDERGLPDASRWSAECALALADLPRFLEGERRAAREGWDPERFEWAFTGDHTLDLVGEGGRRLSIAGRIDRIDLRGPKARREALVIDYKTAARPIDGNALGKSELQLPIYARVVRECLAIPIVDASYVSLRDGSRSPKSMSQVLEDAPPAATDAALEATLWRVLDGVAAGEFDPRPLDPSRTCVGCPHGALCRIDRGDDLEAAREG